MAVVFPPPHRFIRAPFLTATFVSSLLARLGAYKAHFFTRCAYCSESPQSHNPPLLYNVEHDPFEAYPLDVIEHVSVVAELTALFENFTVGISHPPPSEIDKYGLLAAPCCNPFPAAKPCHCDGQTRPANDTGMAVEYTRRALQDALPHLSLHQQMVLSYVLEQNQPSGMSIQEEVVA